MAAPPFHEAGVEEENSASRQTRRNRRLFVRWCEDLIEAADVTAHLEQLAAKNSEQLNFKTSIVDLLKLLDIDSSAAARRELADELGAPAGARQPVDRWAGRP